MPAWIAVSRSQDASGHIHVNLVPSSMLNHGIDEIVLTIRSE
jgi:hypothetical protein